MDIEYRRDMNHNYMIVKGIGPCVPDDYETRVIQTNRIPGLLTCRMQYIDSETWYSYDITSLQRLTVFCESRKIGKKELVRILTEILRILEGLEDYLLDFQHLILQPSSICMDFETMEIRLMYVPFYRKDIRRSLRELTEYLLGCADHSDQSAIVLGYRFCHEVQENNTQLSDLMGVLCGNPSALSGEAASDGITSYYSGSAADPYGEGSGREMSAEEPRKAAPYDLNDPPERESADRAAKHTPGRAIRENAGGKGILPGVGRPAAIVVATGLIIYAVVYALLHTGLIAYISIYTAGGICAAICAAALAAYIIMNKRNHKADHNKTFTGSPDAYELLKEGNSVSGSDSIPERLPERTDDPLTAEAGDGLWESYTESAGEMTAILSSFRPESGPEDRWLLPVSEGYDKRHLDGEDLLIGKQQQYVDMAIDSPTVSRIHARLRFRAGRYFLEDLSSRNGTMLNDDPVSCNEERVLTEGDVITFADVSYIFSQTEDRARCEIAGEGV